MLSQLFTTLRSKDAAAAGDLDGFIIHALLTYRVTSLLVHRGNSNIYETGPHGILEQLRKAAGVVYTTEGKAKAPSLQPNELAKALVCMWCCSVWVGLAVAILNGKGLGYGLSLSAAALAIEKYMGF